MRSKTLLDILIVAGLATVVVAANMQGRNLLTNSKYWWVLGRTSVLFIGLSWFVTRQFHATTSSSARRAKWISRSLLGSALGLLSVTAIIFFAIAQLSPQEWTWIADRIPQLLPPVLAPAFTGAAIGMRIGMSGPDIDFHRQKKQKPE